MSEQWHTPGPWTVKRKETSLVVQQRVTGEFQPKAIAVVARKNKANAHLIAAAPDMLARLKAIHAGMNCICQFLPYVGKEAPCDVCQIATLIAKAEGR